MSNHVFGGAPRLRIMVAAVAAAAALGIGASHAHALSASPTSLTFAPQKVGTTSGPQAVILTACPAITGCSHSQVRGWFYTGHTFRCPTGIGLFDPDCAVSEDFVQSNNCPAGGMAPDTSCTMLISFKPTAAGARLATLHSGFDAFAAPVGTAPGAYVLVSGKGTPKKQKCKKRKRKKRGGRKAAEAGGEYAAAAKKKKKRCKRKRKRK